jgi:hypothetical protein
MELFSYEMEKVKKTFIEEQAKFAAPQRQEEPQYDPEAEKAKILANPVIKSAAEKGFISVGPSDTPLNLGVKKDKILPLLYDAEALDLAMQIKDGQGNPTGQKDPNLALKVAALIADPVGFEKALINHGRTLGKKGIVDTVENIDTDEVHGSPAPQEKTLWDAMRNGKIRHVGGNND